MSCVPYGLPEALHHIRTVEEGYVAAHGRLTFDDRHWPRSDGSGTPTSVPSTQIKARLLGKALTKSGFTHQLNTPLTLQVICLGPWCAGGSSGREVLAFLEQTKNGYTLTTTPCSSHIFFEPTEKQIDTVARCIVNKRCPESQNQ